MLMIAAALEEELDMARSLCSNPERMQGKKSRMWQGVLRGKPTCFLKTGVGPKRSAENLRAALRLTRPSHILVVGYAGALDPGLRLGTLVAVQKAVAFSLDDSRPAWDRVLVDGEFALVDCESLAGSALLAGLSVRTGDTLTSSYVLGDPAHKQSLYDRFHASIVDMETAALARIAQAEAIPLSCIRVVSDEAADTFLAPFSHDFSAGLPERAARLFSTGVLETYREWKTHSTAARQSLGRFLAHYL